MWLPVLYSIAPISNHMDGLTTFGYVQTAGRINDSLVEWLIRNVQQCQAVRTNSWGDSGFPNMLRVILLVLGYFSPLDSFLELLYLLQSCRLSNMVNGRDAEKPSCYFLIGNFVY